jgi:riboflavin synthase
MFTGLVERTGILVDRTYEGEAGRLNVEVGDWEASPNPGDSIAVEGVCLTATSIQDGILAFDVLEETFRRTNLGQKALGQPVNLERALGWGDRMGGHIVNGHVDGVGIVRRLDAVGRDWVFGLACEDELREGLVYKGCVACNGVSLTVASLQEDGFEMYLIPETMRMTSLAALQPGDPVNLEIDIIGKYVKQFLQSGRAVPGVTWERLRETGLME